MIRYHLKSAIKFILKFRSHTAFSLTGLTIGLACVFIISAWVIQELRFDRFHHQADHIYMVTTDIKDNTGNVNRFPETPAPLASALETNIPQIETGFHFQYLYGGRSIGTNEITFKEEGIAATPAFLKVFNFQLLSGVADELAEPNSIFLSKRLADKMFPGGDPVRKELLYRDSMELIVKGIFKDVPRNSSLQFDFLIPYEIEYGISDEWWQLSDATFIKTRTSADIDKVYTLMKEIWRERITDDQYNIGMIPITDLRYGADFEFFNAEHGHGSRKKLYMFLAVAMMILILACFNYMILISAYAIKRDYEIWIRKVHGASAGNITNYFIIESVLLSIFAWGLATLLSILGLRVFEHLMGIVISSTYFYVSIGLGFITAIIIVGLGSGLYPAIRAGSDALVQSNEARKPKFLFQTRLKNTFIMSQFVLSIVLSISSLTMMRQAHFMREFDTGYAKQGIADFYLPAKSDHLIAYIKNWLNARPDVEGYSFGSAAPVNLTVLNTTEKWRWKGLEEGAHTSFYRINVDEQYLHVFHIPLTRGRFFSSMGTDQNRIVINEKLAGLLGFENPVGQILRKGEEEYEIIGVVQDFNFQHLSVEIRPLVLMTGGSKNHLFVKIISNKEETIGDIQEEISESSDNPVKYSIIIEDYDQLYKGEQQLLSAILIFTFLNILLSVLGLIGLVTNDTEARTKEIAIKKVFGAENGEIMITLNLNLLKFFLPSIILGCLISWWIMWGWLQDYAYRRGLEIWLFILGVFIIFVVAVLSVSIQTWKAARQSPAVALQTQ